MRRTRKGLMPVMLAAIVLIVGAAVAAKQHGGSKSQVSAAEDLQYVWSLADMIPTSTATVSNGHHWLLRYDVDGMRSGQALRAAGLLGLHKADASTEGAAGQQAETDTYVGTIDTDTESAGIIDGDADTNTNNSSQQTAVEVSMLIHTDHNSTSSVIVVKPPSSVGVDGLQTVANTIEQAVHEAGGQYEYSFRVSGTAAPDNTVDKMQSLKQLFTDVVAKSDAVLVENYEDKEGMTISESRFSPHIERTMKTGGKTSNLQLTVHLDSESTALDWVIGVPVITGDYTEAD
ncbi:TATA-box binding protein [Paenibacillus cellulosilyticus]|uniref:TATA-box binding protein n=1 Tax=Paenibacillus cellulosilyticus TaxID=375489 RepID=A0A2V2YEP8_9BACL|nr:TATA-box binding protein [Paenibacillus cellulosilyticus]